MESRAVYQIEEERYQQLKAFMDENPDSSLQILAEAGNEAIILLHLTPEKANELLKEEYKLAKAAYQKALQDRIAEVAED